MERAKGFEPSTPTLARPRTIGQIALFRPFLLQKIAQHIENTLQLRAFAAPPITNGFSRLAHVVGMIMPIDPRQRCLAH